MRAALLLVAMCLLAGARAQPTCGTAGMAGGWQSVSEIPSNVTDAIVGQMQSIL